MAERPHGIPHGPSGPPHLLAPWGWIVAEQFGEWPPQETAALRSYVEWMANALFGPLLGVVEAMIAREHTPLPGDVVSTNFKCAFLKSMFGRQCHGALPKVASLFAGKLSIQQWLLEKTA